MSARYRAWDRFVLITDEVATISEHVHDARGYRIRKDSYTSGTLSEARHYYYTPGWQVVEERVGSSTAANRQFVWGLRYIDDLVLRDRDTDGNGTLDERRYCLQDGNWNTIAIADTSGTVTERCSYDAYGVPTFLTSGGTVQASLPTGWETLYAGYRWDGDPAKMYYVRNRMLLPYVGTWNRRDPIGYSESKNLLQYVTLRPTSHVDAFGLQSAPRRSNAVDEFWEGLVSKSRESSSRGASRSPFDRMPIQTIGQRARMGTLGDGAGPNGETYCIPTVHNGIVMRGGTSGPPFNLNFPVGTAPSVLDNFSFPLTIETDIHRNSTPWWDERYPGHNEAARQTARQLIENGIRSGDVSGLEGTILSQVGPSNDNNSGFLNAIFGENFPLAEVPQDFGEQQYGDKRQTPGEANISGPGTFSYRLGAVSIQRQGQSDNYRYHGVVEVMDNLGVSPDDNMATRVLMRDVFQARDHELRIPARWYIHGTCSGAATRP